MPFILCAPNGISRYLSISVNGVYDVRVWSGDNNNLLSMTLSPGRSKVLVLTWWHQDNADYYPIQISRDLNWIKSRQMAIIYGWPRWCPDVSFSNFLSHHSLLMIPLAAWDVMNYCRGVKIHVALLLFLHFHFSQVSVRSNYGRKILWKSGNSC